MKQLTINWQDLSMAFEDNTLEGMIECTNYLDTTNGEVVFVDDNVRSNVSLITDELYEELPEDAEFTDEAIRETDTFRSLSELEKPSVLAAIKMVNAEAAQFKVIPHFDSHDAYGFMEGFVATISDEWQRASLGRALNQRKPFRRFREVLEDDRQLQRKWREFEHARQHEMMIEWLHSIGIEPTNPNENTYILPPLPDLRKIMFAETRRFVHSACNLAGIKRIALIGTLTTDKPFPRGVDLLVTVSDDCTLEPLAKLARQLSGRMNNHQAGAEVFLASEDGRYLGRTCTWKNCGPGYRMRCDALNCGKRHYLHDDLGVLDASRLKQVIARPPVVLWPDPAAVPNVPLDVHEQLIEPLSKDVKR